MHDNELKHSHYGRENHGLYNLNNIYWNQPTSVFSACYDASFMPLHPSTVRTAY